MVPAPARTRQTQQERSEATSWHLTRAARELFARDGYAETSLDEVSNAAGVTKGALYHHFAGKHDIFRAVYAAEQQRLASAVGAAYQTKRDSWDAFYAGCRAFLEATLDPGVQRIIFLDAPGALGWETMRELETDSFQMTRVGVRRAMQDGRITRRPVEPLAVLLFGAVCEAAMAVVRSGDHEAMLRSVLAELRTLLRALALPRPSARPRGRS